MKATIYLRVARGNNGRPMVKANVKPSDVPLYDSANEPLPTVAFGVQVNLPDVLFARAEQVIATINVPEDQARIAAEVIQ